ncbi:uncharacterized protein LOC122264117 [Penaeus japonicus]|uniref:uncharacterized protein LOC122264117 n=1 Tax=Penaeus japonicus TaxID=27405 RepID=UPI001C71208E|nr:uncharacterized protein LOC122264117 [Penaeus japonicus]
MKVVAVALVCLLGMATVSCTTSVEEEEDVRSPLGNDLSPSEEHESLGDDTGRGGRILAYYGSTTTTRLLTSTLTALSTCLSTADGAPACKRRKRRSAVISSMSDEVPEASPALDGALADVADLEELSRQQRDALERDDRRLTIWTTNFTTLTLTTTSYLAGTTVTATAYCLTPLLAQACFGK